MTERQRPVVVVGDALLDCDIDGSVSRYCPDGSAPVFDVAAASERPGGAGLAAVLAAQAGVDVVFVAPVSDDSPGNRLAELIGEHLSFVRLPSVGRTPTKTRLRTPSQHVVRVDDGGPCTACGELPEQVTRLFERAGAILVSDYGQGFLSAAPVRRQLEAAAKRVPLVWDPHPRGGPVGRGATLVTPNDDEALRLAGAEQTDSRDMRLVHAVADRLVRHWQADGVAVTLGGRGAFLAFGGGAPMLAPAKQVCDEDSCGAGDCFAATVAVTLARGKAPSDAVVAGVAAASEFVGRGGASSLTAVSGGEARAPATWPPPATATATVPALEGSGER